MSVCAGRMFVGVFEVALAVPREYPEHPLLRARYISCVHRLVEALQVSQDTRHCTLKHAYKACLDIQPQASSQILPGMHLSARLQAVLGVTSRISIALVFTCCVLCRDC